jgi:DNA-binding transcriptional regulator YhcF (GntR family)
VIDDGSPLFRQIAERIVADILDGTLPEQAQVPSTNEFAALHRINPATAAKGVNELVDAGILYKKRGIGMFVATGARERLQAERRERFAAEYVEPLVREAARLGIGPRELQRMVASQEVQA